MPIDDLEHLSFHGDDASCGGVMPMVQGLPPPPNSGNSPQAGFQPPRGTPAYNGVPAQQNSWR